MNILKSLILPSNIALAFLLAGLLLAFFSGKRRYSWALLALSGLTALAFSTGTVASLLLSPLEYAHPALTEPGRYPLANKIVVLTGYAENDSNMSLSGKLNDSSAFRILEAANIHGHRPDTEIIVSGSGVTASIMLEQLRALHIPEHKLHIDDQSVSTAGSAGNLAPALGENPFFLVTSAGHMPRAMSVFLHQGLHPIPAPTDYKMPKDAWNAELRPSPMHLYFSNLAIHEYAGMLWYRLTGKI